MPSALATIARRMKQSAKQSKKRQMSDVKKLAKLLNGMGKEVAIGVTGTGYSVTSIAPGAAAAPEAIPENEWDVVLK